MDKKILKKAEEILRQKKVEKEIAAKLNLDKAVENVAFRNCFETERAGTIALAKEESLGNTPKKEEFLKLNHLREQEQQLLKNMGMTLKDIYPNYECKLCNDTGYVQGEYCVCLKKEINKLLFEELGRKEPLKTFEQDTIHHKSFEIMKKWCELNNKYLNVIICGPVGTGKTFLAECVANELIKKNMLVAITTAIDLNNNMLGYHVAQNEEKVGILQNYLDAEVLIIDDLGTEPMLKNVTKEYLYYIISERMNMKKRTIITTNLDLNNLNEYYEDRIASRLIDKRTTLHIYIDQEDLRMKK